MPNRDNGDSFDYVIVGAGTAGCVLANRLSEDQANRVLLIEAGPKDSHPFIHVPALVAAAMVKPSIVWGYWTVPQQNSEWTEGSDSARARDWRHQLDQRHGLHARESQGLRRLGRGGKPRLELFGGAPVFSAFGKQ